MIQMSRGPSFVYSDLSLKNGWEKREILRDENGSESVDEISRADEDALHEALLDGSEDFGEERVEGDHRQWNEETVKNNKRRHVDVDIQLRGRLAPGEFAITTR